MKELNLNISLENIDLEKINLMNKLPSEICLQFIETAIANSYTEDSGKSIITEAERRKAYKLLDRLEENKDGIISISDDSYAFLQERWRKTKFNVAVLEKNLRKILNQVDKIVLPDEVKEDI